MTTLLSEAIRRIQTLPPELQDEIAAQLLEDIEGELKWQKTLSRPQRRLDQLAEKALQDSAAGRTRKTGFDEL